MSGSRELYRSPTGDCWCIARDDANGHGYVVHVPNVASGGQPRRISITEFLGGDAGAPEKRALLRLIGTLATDMPNNSGASAMYGKSQENC